MTEEVAYEKPALYAVGIFDVGRNGDVSHRTVRLSRRVIMKTTTRLQWQYLYYVLAVFDVLTVILSLYLSIQLMRIYRHSVAVNQLWARRVAAYASLSQLAMAVNAPGNDIFSSYDVGGETARMQTALHLFTEQLTIQRQELLTDSGSVHAGLIQKKLEAADILMTEMTAEAEKIFAAFRVRQPEQAGPSMATMDRKYAALTTLLTDLHAQVRDIQDVHFTEEIATATHLQRYEYVIAACILLMVSGATVYGRTLAAKIAEDDAVRRRSEAALQKAHHELEQRVAERTRALVGTNRALQQEIAERTRMKEQLARLSHDLLSTQEQERRHLARELHDELGQSLTALRLGLEMLETHSPSSSESLRESMGLVDTLLQRVRSLSLDLRPAMLDDLGLASALEWYVTRQVQLMGVAIHLDAEPLRPRPEPMIETVCFRVVQEALTNVARHAHARNVWIMLRQEEGSVVLVIRDDGIGFAVDMAEKRAVQGASMGMLGMRERVALVGGSLTFTSKPGEGTRIDTRIPLQQDAPEMTATLSETSTIQDIRQDTVGQRR